MQTKSDSQGNHGFARLSPPPLRMTLSQDCWPRAYDTRKDAHEYDERDLPRGAKTHETVLQF